MSTKINLILLSLSCFIVLASNANSVYGQAPSKEERIGFSEDFDKIEGWKTGEKNPLAGMEAKEGLGVFKTYIGSFMGSKPIEQTITLKPTSEAVKEYDMEIDLDKYKFLIAKIDEKSMFSILRINGKETEVAYTSGIISEDLAKLGFKGRKKLRIAIEIMNNGRELKIDYLRLASSLNDEEKKGLIVSPVRLYKENIQSHPYQKLEALYSRSARPLMENIIEEKFMFRDVGTGAVMWRVTGLPGDEGFSEEYDMWKPDGSGFYAKGSRHGYFDYKTNRWEQGGSVDPNPEYEVSYREKKGSVIFKARNHQNNKMEVVYDTPVKQGPGNNKGLIHGDKMVALIAGVELIVVDMKEQDKNKRIKTFPLGPDGAKGGGFSYDGKYFIYYSPFGSYGIVIVDLETGKVEKGSIFTFTHGMGGSPYSIMAYGGGSKLIVSEKADYGGNSHPGNELKVYGVYLDAVQTDYGGMTRDCRYGITNGTGGELAGQHVMFDATDPGTVLRLCNWRISRIQWNLFTKAIASPDYTKLVHLSDMLGNGNYYFCIMRLPDAPKELKASKQQGGVKLEWKIPERHAELKGYNIYKSNKSGNGFKRLNLKVISETAYLDTESGSETGFYMVAAEEYSGLEGFLSREASAGGLNGPVILHYEAEECEKTLPMREVLDGYASGYRSMRVTKVAEGEDSGSLTINPGIFKKGSYLIWARCKNASGGDGKFSLKVQGKETAVLKGVTGDWSWIKSTAEVSMSPGDKLLLVSNDDGLAVDKIVITNDNSYKPVGCDDRKGKPAAVLEFKASEVTANSVKLEWKPNMDSDLYYYSVYVSEKPDFSLDNETVLCSGEKTIALDWGIKSNTKYCYKVVAVDKRGNMSDPVTLEVKTSGLEIVTKDIESGKAKLSSSLKTGTTEGVNFVEFPKDAVSGNQSLTFDLDIIKDGSYYFWIENSPRQIGARTVKVLADGKDVGYWSAREPLRLGSAAEVKLEDARWFVERLSIAPNIWGNGVWKSYLNFNTGKHTLTIEFDEKKAGLTPLISKIWYSNDASFIPPGYNVQARFNKLKRQ